MSKIEKRRKLIIYPSYSLRDYKTNKYLLDSDAEYNQAILEASVMKDLFEETYLIVPKEEQIKMDNKFPNWLKIIRKKYEINVGKERFSHDVKFFKELNIEGNDVLYSYFLNKWKFFEESGINQKNLMYSFIYFYPEYNPDIYRDLVNKNYISINFFTKKALEKFSNDTGITKNLYVVPADAGHFYKYNINYEEYKKPSLIIPARLDHEDVNHTWQTLSIALALKLFCNFDFKLIVCNSNNSADIGYLADVVDEIGPFTRERFLTMLLEEQGVILTLKEADEHGTKGAPEYLGSNLILVSSDYSINPYDVPKGNSSQTYNVVKKLLSINKSEYIQIKEKQKNICKNNHGENVINDILKNILQKKVM